VSAKDNCPPFMTDEKNVNPGRGGQRALAQYEIDELAYLLADTGE